jgi:dTDP-4-amino-4,6-dideoxygalactose transaminase
MIPFVEAKQPDHDHVRRLLAASQASGTWSNFGPVSTRLEGRMGELLGLPPGRRVVACASGTAALHALVHLYEHRAGRPLRWVVSAFTFHAQRQGPLAAASVLDCDPQGYLDLADLESLPADSYDGIVVTNLFGTAFGVEGYESLAARNAKVLLFDSATCVGSRRDGKPFGSHGAGEIYSFHHTKPCGFGEGGCAIVPAELEDAFRSLINFGLYKGIDTGPHSFNGKMSDVAAAFIIDRLRHCEAIQVTQQHQFERIAAIASRMGLNVLVDSAATGGLPNLVPILFPRAIAVDRLSGQPMVLHKYYRPLVSRRRADDLYARVVCLPCHGGMAEVADETIAATLTALAR